MLGNALGALSDLGGGGVSAIVAVTLFVAFSFWAGSLGSSRRS